MVETKGGEKTSCRRKKKPIAHASGIGIETKTQKHRGWGGETFPERVVDENASQKIKAKGLQGLSGEGGSDWKGRNDFRN